jgi:hypothetical protein
MGPSSAKSRMTFEVHTATSTETTVLWDVAPRSLVLIDRRFREAYCLHYQGDRLIRAHLKRPSIYTRLHDATS